MTAPPSHTPVPPPVEPSQEAEQARWEALQRRIEGLRSSVMAATARRGPSADPRPPRIIAAAKKHPVEAIRGAFAAGLTDFGENYAQEFQAKHQALNDLDVRWHFIGALQSNKVKAVVGKASLVHTVDRPSLLAAIDARARAIGIVQDTLVEVNLGAESQKAGVTPNALPDLLEAASACGNLRVRGLMIIPPASDEPERTRPFFRELRELRDSLVDRWRNRSEGRVVLEELSMGMSEDFEIAIEEGATMIRLGTSIFGPRPTSAASRHEHAGS